MAKARKPARKGKTKPCLTLEEIRFVHAYFAGETRGNATRSYLAAGFPERESLHATTEAASNLMTKPEILAYFKKVENDACEAEMVTTCGIVAGFKRGSEADIALVIGRDGFVLPIEEWPDEVRLAVTRFECEEIFETEMGADLVKTKKLVGHRWKVWLENKTDCRKVLAQIRQMIGSESGGQQKEQTTVIFKDSGEL